MGGCRRRAPSRPIGEGGRRRPDTPRDVLPLKAEVKPTLLKVVA
jgi:hypothetical protein